MSAGKEIKRGSRAWFTNKLNSIEALGGVDTRAAGVAVWLENRFAADLEHFERVLKLRNITQKIKDPAAIVAIEIILTSNDRQELERVLELLSDEVITDAITAQGMDEDCIRDVARRLSATTGKSELSLRRKLRQQAKQGTARINMVLGLIGSNKSHHATQHELDLRNEQKARWRKFGESITLIRDDEAVSMLTTMQAAGKKKFGETYTLVRGLESYATASGLTWAFLTLTAPPRMHPNPDNGHSTWDGTTPDEAHKWIHNAYRDAESRLRTTHGIVISGMRAVEPHLDGCPHHHVLIFARPEDMATIEAVFRQQPEWRSAPGLVWRLNDGTASAASYCFKYISKTINSIEALEGEQGTVDAWRSTWGVRAFQFFGMPPRGLWRNLRALEECPAEPLLAAMWRAARRGDGHAFIGLAGGLNVKSKKRPVVSRVDSDPYEETKTLSFIVRDTAECIHVDIKKWRRTSAAEPREANNGAGLAVITNYPRKAKTTNKTASGRAGFAPCTAVGGGQCLIRGTAPPPIPPPTFPVGSLPKKHHNHAPRSLVRLTC